MADEHDRGQVHRAPGRFLGSLREALSAAAKDDTGRQPASDSAPVRQAPSEADAPAGGAEPGPAPQQPAHATMLVRNSPLPTAAEAARAARGGTPNIPPVDKHVEFEAPPTTRVLRPEPAAQREAPARTQLVRGRQPVKRGQFHQDPVVGWLVVVGGPGLGSYRAIHEGNNTIGRSPGQRLPIDFGDEAISAEEQAYIRYDSADRSFLFVPNLAKTNVVSVNDKRPTAAVPLAAMDVITMGRTQLVFVPFCGPEFDWSELPDIKD
ncbi:MAG: FHA domain-containing protein [Hyphomicrobiaceae bacterium]|nr:FHA domain-containing protein [Hyphomicrobiaceae bacterium]